MGLKHEAKKGTIIQANGVTVKVLRGNPQLEITTDEPDVAITTTDPDSGQIQSFDQSGGANGFRGAGSCRPLGLSGQGLSSRWDDSSG